MTTIDTSHHFKVKGFHLDLRIQVMTPKVLKLFVDELACLGLNTLIMEYEATFPFKQHPLISNQYSYSEKEIDDFIAYCTKKGIDVIPLQQCFGHIEYILRHEKYADLREDAEQISQLCPLKAKPAKKLFEELFKELIAKHPSKYFHIGADETWLLGRCKDCKEKALKTSKSKLYIDYIKMICSIVKQYNKIPVMWADIVLKHQEAAAQLPKDIIFIDWNYGWDVNRFGNVAALQKLGLTFWGAPALRSSPDNYYLTSWKTHFQNLKDFIPYARQAQYEGMILTSWSTSGGYSFLFDLGDEVIDEPLPIRRVYPLNGFRILAVAYAHALHSDQPIHLKKFVMDYTRNRFSISEKDALLLWSIFNDKQEKVWHGIHKELNSITKQTQRTQKHLKAIKSIKQSKEAIHTIELKHLELTLTIRLFYLKRIAIEKQLASDTTTSKNIQKIASSLKQLQKEAQKINQTFAALHKGFLYASEIEAENKYRNRKLDMLVKRIFKDKEI